jgi:hypothetical protein
VGRLSGRGSTPSSRVRVSVSALGAAVAAFLVASVGVAADEDYSAADSAAADPGIDFQTSTTTFGGAAGLDTSRTVQHWSGATTNPVDGVTYRYNIVGADPSTGGSALIGVDIIPVNVNVAGASFNGGNAVNAVLASPLFHANSYASTPSASTAMGGKGAGGALSSGNDGVQLLDATMRSEFDKVGPDATYHVLLDSPVVYDPVTINVPDGMGILMTPGFITYANIDSHWFSTRIQNQLGRLHLDPSRLAIFLTDDVIVSDGPNPAGGFVLGAHGAGPATSTSDGSAHGNGNQPVQTFVWGSWLTPGFFRKATNFMVQDVYALSHEVVEWANNPFADNSVLPWQSVAAPQYGCSDELETGDPVFRLGFTLGHNPLHERFSDGTYHLSDAALLPWFMRSAPATQDGRFTFLGNLNPDASFHQPAPTC